MLPKRTFYIVGASFLFVSAFLLTQSFGGFTGYAVFQEADKTTDYFLFTMWFLIAGLFVVFMPKLTSWVNN
jgi:hypothetical protein